jgi:hypothetical protein
MSELWKEIEEDIRTENTERLWRNFGKTMVRVSVAVLVGTVGGVMWNNHNQSVNMERTSQFIQGTDKLATLDYKGAIAALDLVEGSMESSHGAMAALVKAHANEALEQSDAAQKIYVELSKAPANSGNSAFVSLAALGSGKQGEGSALPAQDVPFYFARAEQYAWQLLSQGKKDEAIAILHNLKDNGEAPRSLRLRATSAAAYLSPPVSMKDEEKHE